MVRALTIVVLAALFIAAGVLKLVFVGSDPVWLMVVMGVVEVCVGSLMLHPVFRVASSVVGGLIVSGGIVVIVLAKVSGSGFARKCGCFGEAFHLPDSLHLLLNGIVLLLLIFSSLNVRLCSPESKDERGSAD
jgi:hypothetical protein